MTKQELVNLVVQRFNEFTPYRTGFMLQTQFITMVDDGFILTIPAEYTKYTNEILRPKGWRWNHPRYKWIEKTIEGIIREVQMSKGGISNVTKTVSK